MVTPVATTRAPTNGIEAQLATLRVENEHVGGYDRDLFRHWTDADHDGCSTRAEVLMAESLEPTTTNENCTVITGKWFSVYDGITETQASDIDIDHVVALAEAWASGAWAWDDSQRERYANDLDHEYALIAVTDNSNQSKSDRDPAEWMPTQSDWCPYLSAWVNVKRAYALSVDQIERDAIERNAAAC